jgi:hypothetical protein
LELLSSRYYGEALLAGVPHSSVQTTDDYDGIPEEVKQRAASLLQVTYLGKKFQVNTQGET